MFCRKLIQTLLRSPTCPKSFQKEHLMTEIHQQALESIAALGLHAQALKINSELRTQDHNHSLFMGARVFIAR